MSWFNFLWRMICPTNQKNLGTSRGTVHEELMFHFRELVNDKIAEGQSFNSAWDQAEQQFGSLRQYEDECQSMRMEHRLSFRIAGLFLALVVVACGGWSLMEIQSVRFRDELRQMHKSLIAFNHQQIQPDTNVRQSVVKPLKVDGTDLTGQILNNEGQPLCDATVLVILKTWPDGLYRQEAFSATTNIEGRFVLPELVPASGQYAVFVAALKDGFAFQSNYQLIQNANSGSLNPITLRLEPASIVTLVVRDMNGKPIPNARVAPYSRVSKKNEDHLIYFQGSEPAQQITDDDGRVLLSCFLTGDSAEISLQIPGSDWGKRAFDVSANEVIVVVASSEPNVN